MTKLVVAFRNYAKAPKNYFCIPFFFFCTAYEIFVKYFPLAKNVDSFDFGYTLN